MARPNVLDYMDLSPRTKNSLEVRLFLKSTWYGRPSLPQALPCKKVNKYLRIILCHPCVQGHVDLLGIDICLANDPRREFQVRPQIIMWLLKLVSLLYHSRAFARTSKLEETTGNPNKFGLASVFVYAKYLKRSLQFPINSYAFQLKNMFLRKLQRGDPPQ